MLANIVQELIKHVEATHTQHEGKNVDYALVGKFIVHRPSFLLFEGDILGFTSDNRPGHSWDFSGGESVFTSTINLASRLLTKDLTQRKLPEGYYITDFPEPHIYRPIKIEISQRKKEFTNELEAIEELFGEPREALYHLPHPILMKFLELGGN
ncbi:hypothetical protein HYY70_03855 [Candidatus Woesearchaeota archaeon]|nr:hypothetical protein [Candidatus Woesearchaeota archaeon]